MSKAEEEQQARLERARAIGLFRYMLIREAADPTLTGRQRGALVRALAAAAHTDPDGRTVRFTRWTLDRWVQLWREGGFDALVPAARQSQPRTPAEVFELATALKKENPARSAAQVRRILAAAHGWAPDERTLQRMFVRTGLTALRAPVQPAVFGRFEAGRPNEIWTGDALHGPRVGGRKTYLFAFLDDHSRAIVGHRWGFAEDTVRLAAALRPALAARGVPEYVYVDNGSAFVDAWLLRACAKLGIKLVHSAPGRPQGRGKIERFLCATKRMVVSPAQPGGTRREVPGSDGLPEAERVEGTGACQLTRGRVQALGTVLWGTRVTWRSLYWLKSNLQKMEVRIRRKDARNRRRPCCLDGTRTLQPPGPGAMPSEGIQGDEWDA
jgi:transposase InsO family protein